MYTITFYSFKGGVGRTMALVNVAAQLAKMGHNVLMVDFDLEAPGLETFERLRPPQPHPGLVEYVTEYMRSRRSPDVRDYIYSVGKIDKRDAPIEIDCDPHISSSHDEPPYYINTCSTDEVGKKSGQLWVMPAGRGDRDYRLALSRLDWRKLYDECEGFLFFEDLKAQWEQEYKFDYVLIDSRTGHCDVKGICTRQLPEAVVLLFIPNEENLVGLRAVCREIRHEREHGLEKDIRIHLVPSNVPDLDDEDGLVRRRLKELTDELGLPSPSPRLRPLVIHRHESLGMLNSVGMIGWSVLVLQRPRTRLAREYRRLVRSLIVENPLDSDGALLYLQDLEKATLLPRKGPSESFDHVEDRLRQIASQFADNPKILRQLARFHKARRRLDATLGRIDSALQVHPKGPLALLVRGWWRRQINDKAGAVEDLLHYLLTPDYFGTVHKLEGPMTALRELIEVSFKAYLQGLASPGVRENRPFISVVGDDIWLNSATEHLLRERRWENAIQYLETVVPEWLETADPEKWLKINIDDIESLKKFVRERFPYLQGKQKWYLAMAYWGNIGNLRSDLCLQARELLLEAVEHYQGIGAEDCQRLALLHWAIGDAERAFHYLDRVLSEVGFGRHRGVSQWTFQLASADEFRQHCDEMRRMIQGEHIRPAFLGPPVTGSSSAFMSPSESPPK